MSFCWESFLCFFEMGCLLLSEKAMAPHSSTLAWKIPWREEPGRLQSMGSGQSRTRLKRLSSMTSQELDTTERLHFHFSLSCIGEGNGNPVQCSCLENPRDGGAWWAAVYGVAQSRTRLKRLSSSSSSSLLLLFTSPLLVMIIADPYDITAEKAMAPHSSTHAWQIPWTEELGRLQSMGSLRVRHDWATSLSLFTFLHWSRKWQPTPVFLPGESQGRGSLVGCRLWGHTESNTTEAT